MNPVLTQLPKAQAAYNASLAQWGDLDTTAQLLAANTAINEAISKGYLVAYVTGMEDVRMAEKVAIQLTELGYNTACISGGQTQKEDGSIRQIHAVTINWRWMPNNCRDAYTI